MVTLTVAICTFNRADLIRQTITRILNEIEENDLIKKVEVIVTNNGSSDKTQNVLCEFNSKIHVLQNIKNLPVFVNAKVMAEIASGEYFWFFGDDDVMPDQLLPDLISLFNVRNEIVSLTMGREDFKDFSILDLRPKRYQAKRLTKINATLNFRKIDRLYGFISGNIHKKNFYLKLLNEFNNFIENNYINKYICWHSTFKENMYFYKGSIIYKCVLDGAGSHFQTNEKVRVQTFIIDASEIAVLLQKLSWILGYLSFYKYLFRPKYYWRLIKQKYDIKDLIVVLRGLGVPKIYIFLIQLTLVVRVFLCKEN